LAPGPEESGDDGGPDVGSGSTDEAEDDDDRVPALIY
jgi:hypothetical protein